MARQASEQSIFLHAIGLPSPADRAAYLDEVCRGDPGVRAEVDALLAAHDRLGGGPPPTGPELPSPDPAEAEAPSGQGPGEASGAVLAGRYRLLEAIGEGGMGRVWMAQQTEPVKRRVAVKLIKAGMDSKQVVARFEAERQALAIMDHPHIAKVLDGGATASGRPYFVMELVKGVPLTAYCDEHQLTPRQRLELFVSVCQAVQHAHQKGIIHRDLKPSNVLVTVHDTTPVVKVIDFGVAKALGQELTDKTLFTGFAQMVGTPLYMSPEQAGQSGLDIDTRSDIYSLGVLLYELLTGTTPFDRERFKQAGYDEIRRIIREEEPPKPSTRLSTTAELPSIAANRGLEAKLLRGLVRGELDWIVMKCLEKDRNRRYDTANSLARDLQRYLADEPVTACPPSAWYRWRKFVRRYRTPVLAAGLVVLALLVGITGTTWNWLDARAESAAKERARQEAVTNERKAQANAEAERQARQAQEAGSYLRLIALINQRLAAHDPGQVEGLLHECPPHLRHWEWGYLNRWYRGTPFVDLEYYTTPQWAWSVAFSPDGKCVAAALDQAGVKLWDVTTGRIVRTCYSASGAWSVGFSPDGKHLASGHTTGTVSLWDPATGRLLRTLEGRHRLGVQEVAFSPDGRLLASAGGEETKLWDVSTGAEIRTFSGHADAVFGMAYSPDGKRLASASLDGTVRLWDVETARECYAFREHQGPVFGVAFSPDGRRVASGGWDMAVKIWDPATGAVERSLGLYSDRIRTVAFTPDGNRLAVAGEDGVVKIVDVASGLELVKLEGHRGFIRRVAFSPDGLRLASACFDNTVKIYEATPAEDKARFEILTFRKHAGLVEGVAVSPDGSRIASAGHDRVIYVWDAPTGQVVPRLTGHEGTVFAVAFSPDGQQIASAGSDFTVRLWDAVSGKPNHVLATPSWMWRLAFRPDGSALAAIGSVHRPPAGTDRRFGALLWNPATGRAILSHFAGSQGEVYALGYSPDGRLLAVGVSVEGEAVRLWDAETAQLADTLREEGSILRDLAFSPDGQRLAACRANEKAAWIWDLKTQEVLRRFPHDGGVFAVAFHPDGKRFASGDGQGTVKLWDAGTGRQLRAYRGHVNTISGLAFSPDGRWLVSSSWDQTVRIWDAAVTTREWYGPEARTLVQARFEKLLLRSDVLASLRADATVPEDIRPVALELAQEWEEDPNVIDRGGWEIVKVADGKAEDYARALRAYEAASRLVPGSGKLLGSLGVAQYRLGQYREVLATLQEAERLLDAQNLASAGGPGCYPSDLAFQAMAHFQLEQTDEARALLGRLRDKMKHPLWVGNAEALAFLREAETLIEK
jgi:eukaryotic-like serine/threonine-protein kinase